MRKALSVLLFTALGVCMLHATSLAQDSENLIINGDFAADLDSWTSFVADFAGVSADVAVVNGEASITNISGAGGEVWHIQLNQILTSDQIDALETGETYTVEFDARAGAEDRQLKLYFGENEGGFVAVHESEFNLSTTTETYETSFTLGQTFGNMKLGFEMGLSDEDVFIDNVSMIKTGEGNGGDEAPPTPEGFIADNTIGGEPVGSGEAFLAAGPNNVEEENIEYRLFFSPTASAPDDPRTADEYDFGTTAGDGDGNGPFGFVISGLEAETEYNFYLYQYDTSEELYSEEPALASTVTGGEDDSEPIGEDIIFNGSFDDGLDNWTPFIADFAGVSASVEVVDGEAAITNIEGAGGEVWHIQLNQILTSDQIEALETGETYTVKFDARSTADDRQLKLYFGENEGGFVPVHEAEFNLSTAMDSYETTFEVSQTFGNMKLGFEMGLSNEDVILDNISMIKTDDGGGETPPTPVGFEATNTVGEEPVGSGEAFLAVGPNNVVEESIEYRLFYSPTADAPEDPTTATEYEFGSTPGDGDGNDAFGFVITGLQPATDYTFWLYQYNNVDDLFSAEPAEASTVTGEEGGDPIDDDIVINGSFDDGLDGWTPFIADFENVSANIEVVDGEVAITNIDGAGGEIWYVQLNQIFTESQISAIEIDGVYKVEFDARSNVAGRQLRLFVGEDGGDFAPLNISDYELSTDMETYEAVFTVPTTFNNMKLGFEMGLSNDDVYIDNVSMMPTDEDPTNINDETTNMPADYELGQNYPNPFNPSTQIQFAVPENADVRLDVYNVMGQRVATLVNESMSAGTHTVSFDARNLASGMYLYRLQAGSTVITRKMTLLK